MAITTTNTNAPAVSVSPKQEKKVKKFKQDITDVGKSLDQLETKMDNIFGNKSAKLICLLRLDMVADKLENINPKWAHQIDEITNALEKI